MVKLTGMALTTRMASTFRLSAIAILASVPTGYANADNWQPPLRIVETNYWQGYQFDRAAYWLDADRVVALAVGYGEAAFGHRRLYLYDTKAQSWTFHDDADTLHCAADGRVRYMVDHAEADRVSWSIQDKKGAFGKEDVVEGVYANRKYRWSQASPKGKVFNDYICDYQNNPTTDVSRIITRLIPEHGYLDFGKRRGGLNQVTSFVRATDGRKVRMPFTLDSANSDIRFYRSFGKYLIWDADWKVAKWRARGSSPVWWLSPDGGLEQLEIAAEPWATFGFTRIEYTALGYLLVVDRVARGGLIGPSGLYLADLSTGKYLKIVAGSIRDTSVSPDGCRILFSEMPRIGDTLASSVPNPTIPYPLVPRWKLIDICADLPKGVFSNGRQD